MPVTGGAAPEFSALVIALCTIAVLGEYRRAWPVTEGPGSGMEWWWFSHSFVFDSMDWSPPGSSVRGILQARILEWVVISFCRGSSQPRDRSWVSCIVGRFFTNSATREAQGMGRRVQTRAVTVP